MQIAVQNKIMTNIRNKIYFTIHFKNKKIAKQAQNAKLYAIDSTSF